MDGRSLIAKVIQVYGKPTLVYCDGNCSKAWGHSARSREPVGGHADDFVYLADDELGEAPKDPETRCSGVGKPQRLEDRLNRWCFIECERKDFTEIEAGELIQLRPPDLTRRYYNVAPHYRDQA